MQFSQEQDVFRDDKGHIRSCSRSALSQGWWHDDILRNVLEDQYENQASGTPVNRHL